MFRSVLLFSFLILGSFGKAASQGEYLKQNQTGYGLGFSYVSEGQSQGTLIGIGAVLNPFCDIGFSIGSMEGSSGTSFTPSIALHPVKNNGKMGVPSLALKLGVSFAKNSNAAFQAVGFLHNEIIIGNSMSLKPFAEIGLMTYSRKDYFGYGGSTSKSDMVTGGGIDIMLKIPGKTETIINIGPQVEYFDRDVYIGINFGLTFAMNRDKRIDPSLLPL